MADSVASLPKISIKPLVDMQQDGIDLDGLLEKLQHIRAELRDEYLQPHDKPWIVGFSGGKDSTILLQFVMNMLLDLRPSQRRRDVHVLSNDTLVESPVLQSFVDATLERIRDAVVALSLPIVVVKTTPDIDNTFWVNLIGRGYPAPNRKFRWCTDRMKIRPTTDYIRSQASAAGGVILLLGVRRAESSARAKVVKRYDAHGRLNPHNDVSECLVFRPIVEMTTEEVWLILTQKRPPWGGSHDGLITLYRNAQGGECPLVTDKNEAPSCGTSSARFGCWTCTVVEKDRSIQGFIDAGLSDLVPLADFRDWLQAFSREPGNRMDVRRNGQSGMGPFKLESRREILRRLQFIETQLNSRLISDAEIRRVEEIWRDDECLIALNRANAVLMMMESA